MHDYGLSVNTLPESDKAAWNSTNDAKYVPPRDVLQTVMSLKAVKVCMYMLACICMWRQLVYWAVPEVEKADQILYIYIYMYVYICKKVVSKMRLLHWKKQIKSQYVRV
jgi:hypothetical protein